jgi:hypothetical protein
VLDRRAVCFFVFPRGMFETRLLAVHAMLPLLSCHAPLRFVCDAQYRDLLVVACGRGFV